MCAVECGEHLWLQGSFLDTFVNVLLHGDVMFYTTVQILHSFEKALNH